MYICMYIARENRFVLIKFKNPMWKLEIFLEKEQKREKEQKQSVVRIQNELNGKNVVLFV